MKPYYDDGSCVIYHGDCRAVMASVRPDASVTLTDAPYNAQFNYGDASSDNMPWPDYAAWMLDVISQCEDLTAGPVMVFLSVTGMLIQGAADFPTLGGRTI